MSNQPKVALITGASQGIGACMARTFHAAGATVVDGALGGLGGCPFAPGAKGNVATEAVAAMLQAAGYETGLDLDRLAAAARFAQSLRSPA